MEHPNEKCIFETLHNEVKCVLSVKESNFNEKKDQNSHIRFLAVLDSQKAQALVWGIAENIAKVISEFCSYNNLCWRVYSFSKRKWPRIVFDRWNTRTRLENAQLTEGLIICIKVWVILTTESMNASSCEDKYKVNEENEKISHFCCTCAVQKLVF